MTEEIAVYKTKEAAQTTPAMLLNLAIEKGAEIDRLEKLMDIQIRWEEREAKKAYTEAMTKFKAVPPDIDKDMHVEYSTQKGITEYNHASLANVVEKINISMSKYGLSAAWTTTQSDNKITVTCRITHVMGYSEETALTAAPDMSGSKNSIQAIGSTITYLERYTLLSLTGLATRDQDDDGKAAEIIYVSSLQTETIKTLIDKNAVNIDKFLKYIGAESIDKITKDSFEKAISALKAKKDCERHPGED